MPLRRIWQNALAHYDRFVITDQAKGHHRQEKNVEPAEKPIQTTHA
jgi:hypothetical protein